MTALLLGTYYQITNNLPRVGISHLCHQQQILQGTSITYLKGKDGLYNCRCLLLIERINCKKRLHILIPSLTSDLIHRKLSHSPTHSSLSSTCTKRKKDGGQTVRELHWHLECSLAGAGELSLTLKTKFRGGGEGACGAGHSFDIYGSYTQINRVAHVGTL